VPDQTFRPRRARPARSEEDDGVFMVASRPSVLLAASAIDVVGAADSAGQVYRSPQVSIKNRRALAGATGMTCACAMADGL